MPLFYSLATSAFFLGKEKQVKRNERGTKAAGRPGAESRYVNPGEWSKKNVSGGPSGAVTQ